MKNVRIILGIISFIIGIIMIVTVSGHQAIYLGSLFMIISISFLFYARNVVIKSEQEEQPEQQAQSEQQVQPEQQVQ